MRIDPAGFKVFRRTAEGSHFGLAFIKNSPVSFKFLCRNIVPGKDSEPGSQGVIHFCCIAAYDVTVVSVCVEGGGNTDLLLGERIDAVVQTQNAVYIFEFKLDDDPTALEQIKQKEYYKKYLLDERDIYIVGVNFDSVKGNLIGWKTAKVKK